MVTIPAAMPAASPEEEPMVTMDVLLLLHVPPVVASVNSVVSPTQIVSNPAIAGGRGVTVAIVVVAQPEGNV